MRRAMNVRGASTLHVLALAGAWLVCACQRPTRLSQDAGAPLVIAGGKAAMPPPGPNDHEEPATKALRLLDAILSNDRQALVGAIDSGADPNLPVRFSDERRQKFLEHATWPAVVLASRVADPWFLEYLLSRGGDANARVEDLPYANKSAFEQAVLTRRKANVSLLIQSGLRLNGTTSEGFGLVEFAAACLQYDIARLLVQAGASPLAGREDGRFLAAILCSCPGLNEEGLQKKTTLIEELRKAGFELPCGDPVRACTQGKR